MKVTFPRWGPYSIVFQRFIENLGLEVIPPEPTTDKTISDGVRIAPQLYCFPLKVNLGNYLSAIRRGADTIFMFENIYGICRFRYYWIVQQKVLSDGLFENKSNARIRVINFNIKNFFREMRNLGGSERVTLPKIIEAFRFASPQVVLIEELQKKAAYIRPREIHQGETDKIVDEILKRLDNVKELTELKAIQEHAKEMLSRIPIYKDKPVPRISLLGEIYTVVDNAVNFDIEKKLGGLGIEVHRGLSLSHFIQHGLFPWMKLSLKRKVAPYLQHTVGGHGREAIGEMVDAVNDGFDGAVQLAPFGCMPETTVRPILEHIHLDTGIPFLSLSFDEQIGEAGVNTRLEAFADVVMNHFKSNYEHISWH
jgi:predicted nucleotide-binding protein (sugar kinase/HSP70/actin superfamily)